MKPERIGRYRILRELGRGAMGVVYLAHDPAIDRKVAVKTISFSGGANRREQEEARQRFRREAKAAGGLLHPGIVLVFDVGTFHGRNLFITMEYIEGQTLVAFTRPPDLLAPEKVLSLVAQACHALDYAHRNQVIHRDIKPANLMLVDGQQLKIMDFGLAKNPSADLTHDGTLMGTPNYMSPEQVMGKSLDGRSDLFSLCVVLYELLTGERPFEGDSISTVIYRILHEEPKEPRILNERLPPALSAILRRGLHKDPGSRFQSGIELAEALEHPERFQEAGKTTQVRSPRPRRAARPRGRRPTPAPRAPGRSRLGARMWGLVGVGLALAAVMLSTPPYQGVWRGRPLRWAGRLLQAVPLAIGPGRQDPRGEPSLPAGRGSGTGVLELAADRPGARFYLDGIPLAGNTIRLDSDLTGRFLRASDGCFEGGRVLEGDRDPSEGPLMVELKDPVVRRIALTSRPEGADVSVDGTPVEGRTPSEIALEACVSHEVTISRAGLAPSTVSFPVGGDWEAVASEPVDLKPLPVGHLRVSSPYPVEILAEGRRLGRSGESLTLPSGPHQLTFRSQAHRVRETRSVQVAADTERQIKAPVPPLGKVRVNAYPGNAVIVVDGVAVEPPPVTLLLGAGEHSFECRWNVGRRSTAQRSVRVSAGKLQNVNFKQRR